MYLTEEQFASKYPNEVRLYHNNFTTISYSNEHVIKTIAPNRGEIGLLCMIREINTYTSISHPCVATLSDWMFGISSHGKLFGKLAIPYGLSVKTVYNEGKITFNEMMGDILSGLKIINDINLSHNDIKEQNFIYYNGHVQYIDFGLVSNVYHYANGSYIHQPKYTVSHRDPEIYFVNDISCPSDVRVDLYAIGVFTIDMFTSTNVDKARNYPFVSGDNFGYVDHDVYPETLDDDPMSYIQFLFKPEERRKELVDELLKYPVKHRKTVDQLLKEYPNLRKTDGSCVRLEKTFKHIEHDLLVDIFIWLLDKAQIKNNSVRCLFNAVYMFRLVYEDTPYLTAMLCLLLSQMILDEHSKYTFNDILEFFDDTYLPDIYKAVFKIVVDLDGHVLLETPWDYAQSYSDLFGYMLRLLNPNYDPVYVDVHLKSITDKNQCCDRYCLDFISRYGFRPSLIQEDKDDVMLAKRYPSVTEYNEKFEDISYNEILKYILKYNKKRLEDLNNIDRYNLIYETTNQILRFIDSILEIPEKQISDFMLSLSTSSLGQKMLMYISDSVS
jgi:serine/threonine protein kinase